MDAVILVYVINCLNRNSITYKPINADPNETVYRGRWEENIQGDPDFAVCRSPEPLASLSQNVSV